MEGVKLNGLQVGDGGKEMQGDVGEGGGDGGGVGAGDSIGCSSSEASPASSRANCFAMVCLRALAMEYGLCVLIGGPNAHGEKS